jgi:hypothetical protein
MQSATDAGKNARPTPAWVPGIRFEEAMVYAVQAHARQARKGSTIPYLAHLFAVAALVIEDGGSEDEAMRPLIRAYGGPGESRRDGRCERCAAIAAPLALDGRGIYASEGRQSLHETRVRVRRPLARADDGRAPKGSHLTLPRLGRWRAAQGVPARLEPRRGTLPFPAAYT